MLKKWTADSRLRHTTYLLAAIILFVAVLSPIFTNPKVHAHSLRVIDESKEQATALSLTVTLASTAITMLPDDTGSAIADELSELSTPLLIIVCILYFEQFMLTSMEFLSLSILIPFAFVLIIASMYLRRSSLKIVAYKFLLIGLLCAIIIPASSGLTYMIRQTFSESIDSVTSQINEIGAVFSEMLNADDVLKFISSFASGVGEILNFAKDALSLLIDAVAILMITSCVIPVITAILFIWCIKSIISSRMENFEDTAMDVIKRLPLTKKKLPPNKDPDDENVRLLA